MKTTMSAGKTISTKELKVVANFTNGFAEHALELSDGTLIFISYHGDRVRIVEREKLDTPQDVINAVNVTEED